MSKQPIKRKTDKKAVQDKPLLPEKYETPVLIALIIVLLLVFLHQAFLENKVFISPDIDASRSLQTFVDQAKKENVFPLWIPYVFSGMPSYASLLVGGNRWYDIIPTVWGYVDQAIATILINKEVGWVLVYYFLFGIGLFVLMRRLGLTKFASFFGSVATLFSMYIIIWIMVGHNTKIAAMAFFPFILLLVMELMQRFRWSYLLALVVAIHLQFQSTHIQMIFYSYLAVGVYLIFMLIRNFVKKEKVSGTIRAGVLLIVASAVAFIMSADMYFSVYQYSKYSIRGASPIVQTAQETGQKGGGLDYQYATNWSFGPQEMITFFIPSFYGFGDIVYNGPLSNNQTVHANTYFGPEPFTDAPQYMGVIVLLLAFIGFIKNRRNPFVWFSLIVIVLSLLIAFGREFPIVYNLLFYHLPYFNKFRAPSLILVLVQIFVPILAAFGVDAIAKARENSDLVLARKMLIWTGVFGGLLVLSFLLQGSIQDFYTGVIQGTGRRIPQQIYPLLFNNMMNDLYISIVICLATTAVIHFYIQRRITSLAGSGALTLILLFDLWRVDYQPMQMHSRQTQAERFATPDYVQFIKDNPGLYRVLPLQDGQPTTSNNLAYYSIQDASGYSGAKLRIYQDMLDVVGLTNPNIMRLLDIKYIITDKPDPSFGKVVFSGSSAVEENDKILPRAFFVDDYKVGSGLEILNGLRTGAFDPAKTVYFMDNPNLTVDKPDSNVYVKFLDYKLQSMKMQVKASGNNLLLLSEVYYPAGWEAYIDGKPAKIYRADYFLRALMVPKGVHEIKLVFHPSAYYVGKELSLGSNGIIVVLLLVLAGGTYMKRKKHVETKA